MWVTSSLQTVKTPTAIALGNFDGVHCGHRRVIDPVLPRPAKPPIVVPDSHRHPLQCLSSWERPRYSFSDGIEWSEELEWVANGIDQPSSTRACASTLNRDPISAETVDAANLGDAIATVVTFFPHPQEFFTGQSRALLTPLREKALQLQSMGVEQLVLLPFNHELASLSPRAFVEEILVRRLQAQRISVGMDFRFGHRRAGQVTDLVEFATALGVEVHTVPLQLDDHERISSSAIRQALQTGRLEQANRLLGRPYTLTGRVVEGQQLGRTIGFPTANLKLPPEKFLPRDGVYSTKVYLELDHHHISPVPGVMNIGHRPTVQGVQRTIEVHLLDWSGNLYGQTLTVSLEQCLRPEQKFASLDELKQQIQQDCQQARAGLTVRDRKLDG